MFRRSFGVVAVNVLHVRSWAVRTSLSGLEGNVGNLLAKAYI